MENGKVPELIAGLIAGVFVGVLLKTIVVSSDQQTKKVLETHLEQQLEVGNAFYDPKTAELRVAVCGESGLFHPPTGQLKID